MSYRIESISDLPPKARGQAAAKLIAQIQGKAETKTKKKSKYGNQKVSSGSLHFDSRKEEQRYHQLMVMLKSGQISDLRLQPQFTLQEAYTTPDGNRIRKMVYTADFSYRIDGNLVVEDVKSKATKTEAYQMRKKLLADKYSIIVQEV